VIKPSVSGDRTLTGYSAADNTRVQYLPGRRVNIQGSLQGLVRWTFGINLVRISGMPSWANEASWDISAKPPQAVNDSDTISEMLRSLLVARFGMKYHFEDRPISSFMLIFTHDGDPGVDLRVPGLDGIEAGLGEIDGRNLLRPDTCGGLLQREGAQIRGRIGERESGGGESPHASGQKAAPGRVLHTLFYRAETRIVKRRDGT